MLSLSQPCVYGLCRLQSPETGLKHCLLQMNVQQLIPSLKGRKHWTDTSLLPRRRLELQACLEKAQEVPCPHSSGLQHHHSTYIKTSKISCAWPQMYLGDSRSRQISVLLRLACYTSIQGLPLGPISKQNQKKMTKKQKQTKITNTVPRSRGASWW